MPLARPTLPRRPPARPKRVARSAALALAALAVAGGAFLAVLHFQPVTVGTAGPSARAGPAFEDVGPDPELAMGVAPGTGATLDAYDGGRLARQFTAVDYTPHKDGTVDVTRPVATFYLSGTQVMVLTGTTGRVRCDVPAGGATKGGMPTGMRTPDSGDLYHVHVDLCPAKGARPTLSMDTDNVHFDNDTLRLYTQRFTDPAGQPVEADRVPVRIRGDDYDMDGTGLTVHWTGGVDPHLHLLEVAHGQRLTIKHPNAAGLPAAATASGPAAGPTPAAGPAALVSADPAAAALAVPPPKPPAVPYRAVFNDDVRIVQLGRTVGLADVMTIDFLQGKSATTRPTTNPATDPTTVAATVAPADSPPPAAADVPPPTTAAASRPVSAPAVVPTRPAKPATDPITVYWTGKLRVTPLESTPPMMPLVAGQSVVRLAGVPASVSYNGATADAAVLTYRTLDDAVRLDPSAARPTVHVARQNGTTLAAPAVAFDPATSVATIRGPAELHVPVTGGQALTATWAGRGLLHVADAAAGSPMVVDHVDLLGQVRAQDPTFNLDAHRLLLDLDPVQPATRPATRLATRPATTQPSGDPQERLRRLTAIGDVACRLTHAGQPDRGIDGDRLVIGMAPAAGGQSTPHDVVADGRVRAFDAQQALHSDHLEAILLPAATTRPTTRPATGPTTRPTDDPAGSVALASLYATGHVKAVLKDGSTAESDALREATAADGQQLVELSGTTPARVTDAKGDRLVGSPLHVAPDRGVVTVDGPGTLHSAGKPTAPTPGHPAEPGRPVDVSWVDALAFDNTANAADVVGHVLVKLVDAKGTVTTAVGDTAHIDFVDPAKPPALKPTAGKPAAAKPANPTAKPADDGNLGSKQVKALTLVGHVHAVSELDVGLTVVRHGELFGDRLVYTAADGVARVPGPGKLFVENHRPPAATPADAGGNRGVMAVAWRDGLVYDPASDRITITGNARVGFQQDTTAAAAGSPMQMRSDVLVIYLRQAAEVRGGPAGQDKARVSRMLATGAVHFRARTADIDCHQADYDPDAGRLVATGSDAEPGRAVDAGGRAVGSADGGFQSLLFDTVKQEVVGGRDVSGTFRR